MALSFRDLRKSFGAVTALDGVSFDVAEGHAHAIVGENGAGKSTLLKILAGLVRADGGAIYWDGARLDIHSPHDAIGRGIGMVYQEMLCFPNLSVSANIFAGRELHAWGWLREREMHARTRELLDRLHVPVAPDAPAESLSAAHRQLLQVARAVAFRCRILILDEPTTALTDAETDHLFAVLRALQREGTTMLYVSHRLPEVFRLCDRITVLRDGKLVATVDRDAVQPEEVVRAMVGRDLPPRSARHVVSRQAVPALELRRLSRPPLVRDVSLRVERGEIVGLFGLVGAGRSELLETVFGLHRAQSGEILVDGIAIKSRSPAHAARAGIALVPEERHRQGLFFNLGLRSNLVLPRHTIQQDVLIRARQEREEAEALRGSWRIKAANVDARPDSLSGGNQQKVVAAKWMATTPKVLLLDEPTKGVDVGAKFEIHELVRRQAASGLAVLMASSDLPEVLSLADRIVVMREGRVQGEIDAASATEESVMRLATSGVAQAS